MLLFFLCHHFQRNCLLLLITNLNERDLAMDAKMIYKDHHLSESRNLEDEIYENYQLD